MGAVFEYLRIEARWICAVDDAESTAAIRRAVDLGVTLFDTADVYGTGHAERVLGAALKPVRDQVVIAIKWSNTYDEARRQVTGFSGSPAYARRAATAGRHRSSWPGGTPSARSCAAAGARSRRVRSRGAGPAVAVPCRCRDAGRWRRSRRTRARWRTDR